MRDGVKGNVKRMTFGEVGGRGLGRGEGGEGVRRRPGEASPCGDIDSGGELIFGPYMYVSTHVCI